MAQKRKGHGGNGVGTLRHTSIRAQPSFTNYQLTLLPRSAGAGGSRYCVCSSAHHLARAVGPDGCVSIFSGLNSRILKGVT